MYSSNAQFAAVDRRALLQGPGRHDGANLAERHFYLEDDYAALDMSPPWPPLNFDRRRQVDSVAQCGTESHSCLSVGSLGADKCCKNSQYCFILRNWTVGCCSIGNDCADATPCKEGFFYQNATITVTTVITNLVTLGPSADPTATRTSAAQLVTASVSPGCGSNPCGRSSFLCQSAFGGQCCGYGSICGSSNLCIAPVTASASEVVSLIPPECSAATEFACVPGNKTAGCCDRGQLCVGDNYCSGMPSLPTGTNATIEASSELSSQAKAGVGAGVAVGAALFIGLLTWFCVRRRREAKIAASRRQSTATGSHVPPTGNPRNNPYAVPLGGGRRGLGGRTASGTVSPDLYSGGAGASGRREHTMSEVSGPTSGGASLGNRPPLHQSGLVYDYFGPDAVPGPYTDHEPDTSPYNYYYDDEGKVIPGAGAAAAAATTGSGGQGGAGVNRTLSRGVPAVPQGPADISRPVEIGESVAGYTQRRGVRRIDGEPPSYSTTPEAVDGISPPPPPRGSPRVAGVGGEQQALGGTTIVTHSGASPVAPPGSDTMTGGGGGGPYDPHHVVIHEMDPQRVGPFELGGPHGHAAPTTTSSGAGNGGMNTSALPTAAAAGHSSGSGAGVSAASGPLRSYEDEEAAEEARRRREQWGG